MKSNTLASIYPLWKKYIQNEKTNKNGNLLDYTTQGIWLVRARRYVLTHSIANLPLTAEHLTPVVCVKWLDYVKGLGLAKYTIKDIVQVIRTMISDGRKKGWIKLSDLPYNPFLDEIVKSEIPVGSTIAGKDNPIHLTEGEAVQLMSSANAKTPLWRKVKNILALTTGARDGELQGLSWSRVDLGARLMVVDRQLKKVVAGVPLFAPPKRGSHRTLPLHSLAVDALRELQRVSGGKGEEPVFPNFMVGSVGQYFRSDSADYFRIDLRAAGVSDQFQGVHNHTIHSCRRTFMTLLADAGVSDVDIGILGGHCQVGVRRHYIASHVERFIDVIEKLPYKNVILNL